MAIGTVWICDTCGERIETPADGWVEWLVRLQGDKREGKGLRLVHHAPASRRLGFQRCQYHQQHEFQNGQWLVNDLGLDHFLGENGLMDLLAMLSEKQLPADEVIEMIKRLFIPGYEEARHHFERALEEGVFDPNRKPGFYSQSDIRAVLAFARKKK